MSSKDGKIVSEDFISFTMFFLAWRAVSATPNRTRQYGRPELRIGLSSNLKRNRGRRCHLRVGLGIRGYICRCNALPTIHNGS